MPLQPDQLLGPYVLIRPLGRGAFGEVWLARHNDLNEERALKIPTEPQFVQQLRREGQAIHSLDHENIVRGHDQNTLNDPPYVAMEYVAGVSLRQKLQAAGKLPVPQAMSILNQVLSALERAHAHGVMHRDLKPENILLSTRGTVKVTDFGLGKVQEKVAQSIVMSGSLVGRNGQNISGTIDYMSPQQRSGQQAAPGDDLYAAGIIACELLTGQKPGPAGIEKLFRKTSADARFVPVIERALEEDPVERFGSSGEMAAAFAAAFEPAGAAAPAQPSWSNSIGMTFVRIDAGEFSMGSPQDEADHRSDEDLHLVKLTRPFFMQTTPVTQKQWRDVMGTDPSKFKGDDLPVAQVSWNDAVEFCENLSRKEAKKYRLPREAEWEYACRAGTSGPYAGTGRLDDMGWSAKNAGGRAHPVGLKQPNAWGLFDMHGNVMEWCSDRYGQYPRRDVEDPQVANASSSHVLHGGSWLDDPRYCRAASRFWGSPHHRGSNIGFRVCMDV